MTYHANARTTMHQRKRIRRSRDPYRVQARTLGVSVATEKLAFHVTVKGTDPALDVRLNALSGWLDSPSLKVTTILSMRER